jgi:hypothetical protein
MPEVLRDRRTQTTGFAGGARGHPKPSKRVGIWRGGHYSSGVFGTSIGTLRGCVSASAIGSSTWRKPSS